MKKICACYIPFFAAFLIICATLSAARAAAPESPVVVELFTSQGCSSCPAADKVLTELAARPDILALSWAVDYWDYLGWKDTFGEKAHSLRQRAYNKQLGRKVIYTPQIFVDGRIQVVGSRQNEIERAIDKMRTENLLRVPVSLRKEGKDSWYLSLGAAAIDEPAAIRMIWFDSKRQVPVKEGENRGKTLTYTNVVRGSQVVGQYDGKAETLKLPMLDAKAMKCDGLAVLIQEDGVGAVLGGAMAKMP